MKLNNKILGDYGYVIIKNGELCYRANIQNLNILPDDFPIYANIHDFNNDEYDLNREAFEYLDKNNFIRIINEFMNEYKLIKCPANINWLANYILNMVDWQDLENFVNTDLADCDLNNIQKKLPIKSH